MVDSSFRIKGVSSIMKLGIYGENKQYILVAEHVWTKIRLFQINFFK